MAPKVQVTFDAADPYSQAVWWAGQLGYEVEDGHDLISGLIDAGVVGEDMVVRNEGRLFFKDAVAANDPDGAGPRLYFQRVAEPKVAKNRVHLDVPVLPEDLEAEVASWTAAGAAVVEYRSHPGHRWAVMQDPEGNEFCLH